MAKHLQRDLDNLQRDIAGPGRPGRGGDPQGDPRLAGPRRARWPARSSTATAQIDREENHIDEECLKILALHQPVAMRPAADRRQLMINTDLERMGDLAEDIAERADWPGRRRRRSPCPDKLQRDDRPDDRRWSARAWTRSSTWTRSRPGACVRMDDEVDRYNAEIIARADRRRCRRRRTLVEPGLSLFSATRHLERIADHATNIAEDVIYLVEGEIVRHRPGAVGAE